MEPFNNLFSLKVFYLFIFTNKSKYQFLIVYIGITNLKITENWLSCWLNQAQDNLYLRVSMKRPDILHTRNIQKID